VVPDFWVSKSCLYNLGLITAIAAKAIGYRSAAVSDDSEFLRFAGDIEILGRND
jgi:hypothetical protein